MMSSNTPTVKGVGGYMYRTMGSWCLMGRTQDINIEITCVSYEPWTVEAMGSPLAPPWPRPHHQKKTTCMKSNNKTNIKHARRPKRSNRTEFNNESTNNNSKVNKSIKSQSTNPYQNDPKSRTKSNQSKSRHKQHTQQTSTKRQKSQRSNNETIRNQSKLKQKKTMVVQNRNLILGKHRQTT